MKKDLRTTLIKIAESKINGDDPSHDFEHTLRVLANAERIAKKEKADMDVIISAALFHDLVVYPKNHPDKHKSQEESAELASKILDEIHDFPKEKIEKVKTCVLECSFTKGIIPRLLESKITQDADGLESTGAISIMRTYSSTGQMKRPFYDPIDPFCKNREPDVLHFALDLFYARLLKVTERMHTKSAKKIAERRKIFLEKFLKELDIELKGK